MSWLRRGKRKDEDADPVAWTDGAAPDEEGGAASARTPDEDADPAAGAARADRRGDAGVAQTDDGPRFAASGQTRDWSGDGADGSGTQDDRSGGPWDVTERDTLDGYLDLGGIRLPGRDGMELRLEVEEASGRVTAATVQLGGSAVQLQAFAAPRSAGIWDEIRAEIASSVTRQGGTADEMPGPFGQELLARIPVRTPDGRTAHQPARFVGVDGPRWFLRGVFHGAAAYEREDAQVLEGFLREIVVVRGVDAMAPRELLTLRLPDAENAVQVQEEEAREPLEPFRRGPEITEVR